jgi:hypothetical protein
MENNPALHLTQRSRCAREYRARSPRRTKNMKSVASANRLQRLRLRWERYRLFYTKSPFNILKPVILNELLLQKKPLLPLDKPKTISYGIAVNYLLQYSETEHT